MQPLEQITLTKTEISLVDKATRDLPKRTRIRLSKVADLLMLTWRTKGKQDGAVIRDGKIEHGQ